MARLHELSIAEAIIEVAVRQADGRRVTKVRVQVGHLRQVVPSALDFSFGLVAEGTPLEGAELEMEEVPVSARCGGCGKRGEIPDFPLQCRACGSSELEILTGEELLVESLDLEEV